MRLLVITSYPQLIAFNSPYLGRLYQPRMVGGSMKRTAEVMSWAADNDGYNGVKFDAYERMLRFCVGVPGCLFVTAPDVLCDAEATLSLFDDWEPRIHVMGLPVALVGQDGMERLNVPWDRLDAFFVGGSSGWKEGAGARSLIVEALSRGKHVHIGRVNSPLRMWYAYNVGAHTIDGSTFGRMPKKTIPKALRIFERLHEEPPDFAKVANHEFKRRWTKEELRERLGTLVDDEEPSVRIYVG